MRLNPLWRGSGAARQVVRPELMSELRREEKLRILIIAHPFPPQNTSGAHRTYSWARTWRDLGHDVHVLTPAKSTLDGTMDMERDMAGIHVHEVPYLLSRGGHGAGSERVTFFRAQRWERLKTFTRRMRFSLAMFGDPRIFAYWPMVRRGMAISRDAKFDVIIATSPPEMAFFVARTLARRTGTPWVADFRDLWFRDMRLHQSRLASWLSGPVNRWLVKSASALVTVSRGLQERLASYLGREVLVSYNGYAESERNVAADTRVWDDGRLHVVYTGRMYPGKRDPEPLFRVLSSLRQGSSRLCVDFYCFDDPWLHSLIAKHRVQEWVTVHGFVPHRESLAVQRAADVLLFLDWTDPQADGVLTGKLFEYLGSGRPILSLGARKDTEAARLIAETQCGVTLTSDEEIAGFVRDLLHSSRPSAVESTSVARFSREKQARQLLAAFQGLTEARQHH